MPKCMGCKKSLFKCRCHDELRGAGTRDRKSGNRVRNGVTWCSKCDCRVLAGRCMNSTCSTLR